MLRITIDGQEVDVSEGATLLDAARMLGIEIPTLCYRDGIAPSTSCLVCLVKVADSGRFVPACGTPVRDGMIVESETEEVHQMRRSALELLLSEHLGDCLAPCYFACPARMDIPTMLRAIAAGRLVDAITTVKADIALPAVLGRICPAPCEKVCRRRGADGAVAICRLKQFVADVDLAAATPYQPECEPASGRRVAIVGAGPAGLSAAYYLTRQGHACTLFEQDEQAGGRLRSETTEEELPRKVLDREIDIVLQLGIELRPNTRVGRDVTFESLCEEFDAVLLTSGAEAADEAAAWGLAMAKRGVEIEKKTYRTNLAGAFAAGNAIRGRGLVIRSVADGKEAAVAVGQYLAGGEVLGAEEPFNTRIGSLEPDELATVVSHHGQAPRRDPAGDRSVGYTPEEAAEQAARCLHCDCRAVRSCKLRHYAARYGANPRRYQASRRRLEHDVEHNQIIFEPGKCINCGLCIAIANKACEPLGLTFVGRGFDVRVGVPLSGSMREALQHVAAECVEACPTAALAWAVDRLPC